MRLLFLFVILLVALIVPISATADHNDDSKPSYTCSADPCLGHDYGEFLYDASGVTVIRGKGGPDDIIGYDGGGLPNFHGNDGNDDVYGSDVAEDIVYGGEGNDWLYGNGNDDQLYAGCDGGCSSPGSNRLSGGGGNDLLGAENGKSDTVLGGNGNDTCFVDQSLDTWSGCEDVR
jgi:Ca2+-binding RTX toxin-like protein